MIIIVFIVWPLHSRWIQSIITERMMYSGVYIWRTGQWLDRDGWGWSAVDVSAQWLMTSPRHFNTALYANDLRATFARRRRRRTPPNNPSHTDGVQSSARSPTASSALFPGSARPWIRRTTSRFCWHGEREMQGKKQLGLVIGSRRQGIHHPRADRWRRQRRTNGAISSRSSLAEFPQESALTAFAVLHIITVGFLSCSLRSPVTVISFWKNELVS